MPRPLAFALAATLALAPAPAPAGVWFDIGAGTPTRVVATGETDSWEDYASYPFGPFPPGSLVFEDLSVVPCESLKSPGLICGPTRFIRGFRIHFNGTGCGCGGALATATTLRLAYDPAVVAAAGATEQQLVLLYNDFEHSSWTPVPGAVPDTDAHHFEVSWSRDVLGDRQFVILTHDVTPARADTWGRLKALYRR